jgi:hypothetical protein
MTDESVAVAEICGYIRDRIAAWLQMPKVTVMVTREQFGSEPLYTLLFVPFGDDSTFDQEGAIYAMTREDKVLRGIRILPRALMEATRA